MLEYVNRKNSDCYKWDSECAEDCLPLWIADMDFKSSPAITEALKRTADHGIYGYGEIDEENLYTEYQNKYGETVEHIYEDCIKDLHPILDKPNQFKGGFFELSEYNGREVQTDYNIWIKII